jgi:hypothetical protein
MGETTELQTNHLVVLRAIADFRADVSTRLGAQDTAIAAATLSSGKAADAAQKAVEKVEGMERVLPMRFFKALDGTATMADLLSKASGKVIKIGIAAGLVWACWKYIVVQTILQHGPK